MDLTLWSLRVSVARGNHFVAERKVTEETAQAWLKIFRQDEPNVLFLVSERKPKEPPSRENPASLEGIMNDLDIENVTDKLKQSGFETPCEWNNEVIAQLIEAVLDGLSTEEDEKNV